MSAPKSSAKKRLLRPSPAERKRFQPRLAADDHRFDEADLGELGGDNAVTAILDVVTATHAGTEHNTNVLLAVLEVLTHLLDLTVVTVEELLPGGLGDVDVVELDEDVVAVDFEIVVVARTLVGLAHDASVWRIQAQAG